jgi:hypothetical protein
MSRADLETATPPSACSLVLGLPMDRKDFEADLQFGAERDYSRNHLQLGRSVDEAWNEDGQPIADSANELAEVASGLGVLVCRAGSLKCVAPMFKSHAVVTFVAHWRASELRRSDFRAEPAELASRILGGTDEFSRALAGRLGQTQLAAALSGPDFATRAGAMAELLNTQVVNSDNPLPGCEAPSAEIVYRPWLRLRHRQLLDEAFSDVLRPGNMIELRDGLHPPAMIAQRIPEGWSGIVDLAMCSSTAAAKIIKAGRSERLVFASNNEVVPQIRLRILREVYRRLADERRNYAHELAWIVRSLRDVSGLVREAVKAGEWGSN